MVNDTGARAAPTDGAERVPDPGPGADGTALPAVAGGGGGGQFSRPLLALILGQLGLHACMAGVRMASALQALRQGHAEWAVGLLLALFAVAPVMISLYAGRLADRHGYHRPIRIAVGVALAGGLAAALSSHYAAMCVAALLTGAGANIGLIVIQRTAGRMAGDATERIRVFSWLGLAPALSNVIGPLLAGALIDLAGFRAAFAGLLLLPLAALAWGRFVPREATAARGDAPPPFTSAFDLLRLPALRHLLLVNWLISASWDMHAFVLPILGHERGFSASSIGAILGLFACSVAAVRFVIPLLAHRLTESQVLAGAMVAVAGVFAVYPFMHSAAAMAVCAALLGMALGSVQPMIMSTLHHITPADRHGEAIALRSIAINLSSSLMPLLFGAAGTALGAGSLFWLMGAAVGAGSLRARRI
jgi:MFS family permease